MNSDKRGIFITATGTDVGKTYVSALMLKKLRKLQNAGYYKPVLSGAIRQSDASLLAGDCNYVVKTVGLNTSLEDCVTYCFEDAVSPHLAAKRAGVQISLDEIKKHYNRLLDEKYDTLLVEGAGGITCPLCLDNQIVLLSDLIKALDLDTIIVADAGLGTINSVVLTVEYAKAQGINILGIILNNYEADNFMHQDNLVQVEKLTKVKVIATVEKGAKDIELLT